MTKEKEEEKGLDWKDYIAIVIAMLTSTLLPFLIFIAILLIIIILFK